MQVSETEDNLFLDSIAKLNIAGDGDQSSEEEEDTGMGAQWEFLPMLMRLDCTARAWRVSGSGGGVGSSWALQSFGLFLLDGGC